MAIDVSGHVTMQYNTRARTSASFMNAINAAWDDERASCEWRNS